MTFTLIKDDVIILTATAHGSWSEPGRIEYVGDASLLHIAPKVAAACYLGGFFSDASRRHKMQCGGDFMSHRMIDHVLP